MRMENDVYASDLIKALTAIVEVHGDLTVENEYGNRMDPPEYNGDQAPCVLVSFDESGE